MADIVSFSDTLFTALPAAFMRTLFQALQVSASTNPELMELTAKGKVFDAAGGWSLDSLSEPALLKLAQIVRELEKDPALAAAHWNPEFRPRFANYLNRFKTLLESRLQSLRLPS
jgi:hypothetical protein